MKIKILLVEDELELRENLRDILKLNYFEVLEAEHGLDGLDKLKASSPDLIVSDILMPVMDDYAFIKEVRSIEKYINLPFIFLTAKVEKYDLRKGMESGAEDYLTKPIQAKDFLNAIEIALIKKQKRDSWFEQKTQDILLEERNIKYHELRTPLFGLMSLLQIIKDSLGVLSTASLEELLQKAITTGDRLNFSLLNLARYQDVKITATERTWIPSVRAVIKSLLRPRDQKIHYKLLGSDFGFWFDQKQFYYIIEELLNNAIKFKGEELLEIQLSAPKLSFLNKQSILDYPQKIIPQAFFQVNRKHFEQQGLGLGLYLASEYAKKNDTILNANVNTDLAFCVELIFPQDL